MVASGGSLLDVCDLRVSFSTPDGVLDAVCGLSFSVRPGSVLGLVGESGSGKSVATQSVVGLTRGARVSGQAWFAGQDLLAMPSAKLREIRGRAIGMIFQNPSSSLHPLYRIGWQIVELIQAHEPMSARQARARAIELLGLVGIPRPDRRVDDYPHQFSGGMLQRSMIAMALALNPRLLIADEPTTALDVTVQAQILRLLRTVQREFGTAIIMITHDLGVVADMSDDVVVMYAGRAMERASRERLFQSPAHPYTRGLFDSLPRWDEPRRRLTPIPGHPPSLIAQPQGCPFEPRCTAAVDRCRVEAAAAYPVEDDPEHLSACWLQGEKT